MSLTGDFEHERGEGPSLGWGYKKAKSGEKKNAATTKKSPVVLINKGEATVTFRNEEHSGMLKGKGGTFGRRGT